MKRLVSGLMCFISIASYSQMLMFVTGKIVDGESNLPIKSASVTNLEKSYGTITDSKGNFDLVFKTESDTIIISHIGYGVTYIAIHKQRKFLDLKEIKLNAISKILDEVVINGNNRFNLSGFIRKASEAYEQQRPKEPHLSLAYFNESAKYEGDYVMYFEGTGYSIYMGNFKNYSPFTCYKFFPENSRLANSKFSWIRQKKYSKNKNQKTVYCGVSSSLRSLVQFGLYGPLSPDYIKKYHYKIDSMFYSDGQLIYRILFNYGYQSGFIEINSTTYELLTVTYHTKSLWSSAFHRNVKGIVKIKFSYYNEEAFMRKISYYYKFKNIEHASNIRIVTQKLKDFMLSEDEFWRLNNYDINPYIQYEPSLWPNIHIKRDIDYKKVVHDLAENETELENQFLKNSSMWLARRCNK